METLFIGKNILFLSEVDSTNTYAMNLLRNVNVIDGTAVYTSNQTHGKGQRGSVWNSEIAANVMVSVILKPIFLSAENAFYLSKITALAVYDVLADCLDYSQFDIKIKWPNDTLVNNKKIAGILIENTHQNKQLQYAVIGIGINVNQLLFNDLDNTATSILKVKNNAQKLDTTDVMRLLFSYLEKWYLKLKESKLNEIDTHYLKHLKGLNQLLTFEDANKKEFTAEVIGVDNDGKIILKNAHQEIKTYELKEIKMIL